MDLRAAARTSGTYTGSGLGTRAYVLARLLVAPLGAVGDELRTVDGRVLSLGSGHGVVERYVAEINPRVRIEGVDLDPRRVELIRATGARSPRVTFTLGDATLLDAPPTYDVILVCDALHHFPVDTHKALADGIAGALVPGGVCVIKELDERPRWKYTWNRLHDRLVAGPEPIVCRSPDDTAALLRGAGLRPERADRTDRPWTPYAHYIVRARKPD